MKRLIFGALLMTTPALAADTYATMPSGVSYHDEVVGTGPEPQPGQTVRVQYTGWLDDNGQKGAKFDSSRDRNEPFSFTIGAGQVIAGWDSGVATMHVGGKRTLIIPPALKMMRPGAKWQLYIPSTLAYGDQGVGTDIGPGSTLIFDVELLGVQ